MMSRYQATRWSQISSAVRYAMPDFMSAVLCMAGVALAVIAAAMMA